ncbi:DUF3164 family protein [Azospirillum agricola]|uniref:DUF3164 family protein n=1 Tax=Azospirillum agricola TaxID=1720247 RepID=UPI000A0EFFE2|nr:DUF3164 family protein [Azospirillum agricola]SMH62868.1 Protein of unknown function [Azospirillum lipoferum]
MTDAGTRIQAALHTAFGLAPPTASPAPAGPERFPAIFFAVKDEPMDTVTTTTIPAGYMADAKGRLVPEALVKPVDKLQDQLVRKLMGYADALSAEVARFKSHTFDDVGAFLALLAEQYDAQRGGQKGNLTLTSYDGTLRVQVAVADNMTFGPELQIAKNLIDECIAEWAADANVNIRALVEHAFRVDKEGQVSRDGVFALRRVAIEDDRWQRAMAAIADSVRIEGTKTYVRFHRRPTPDARWEAVTIDLASA